MLYTLLFFVLISLSPGKYSVRGRGLVLSVHPFVVRLRYVAAGVLAGVWLCRGTLADSDGVAWLGLALLIFGAVRRVGPALPANSASSQPVAS